MREKDSPRSENTLRAPCKEEFQSIDNEEQGHGLRRQYLGIFSTIQVTPLAPYRR